MADSILRLKVESQEYDNKLKQAANELTRYVDQCRKVGGTLEYVEKETLEYVRAIGQMDTTSRTATGKLAEMKKTFVELSAQYKQLTDAEKNSPFGKALAESLDELKPRIIDAKNQLDEINGSLKGMPSNVGGGLFSGMGDKMSGAIQVFAGNMMTKAAGAVAELGSEIFASVQQGIELARQGEGIRIAFERLGRGDILQGLREATHGTVTDLELMKAAVKFNDFKLPLDELGILLQFAQQKAKDTGQSVDFLVESIVNGLGRKSLMILDNLGLSATEIKEKMAETGDMTKAVGAIIREQMSKAGDYVETAADRAAQADVELKNAMEELGRTFQPLTDASDSLWNSIKVGALNALNTAVKPLIKALSEAGTLGQGARSSAGFNNLGGNSKVDRMIGRLGNGKSAGAYSIYKQQLAEFDKYINNKKFQIAAYGGDNSSVAQSAKAKLQTDLDGALKMREEYVKRAQELHNQVPSPYEPPTTSSTTNTKGGSSTTTHKTTSQETAANKIKEAERTYAETLLKNSIRLEEGMDTTLEYKKRELSAQERLFDAYNDAYATYQDPAYKKASTEAAEKIKTLAGEVKAASDAQEAARKSARELDAAQRKLADAQQKLAEARDTGSATAIYKAQQEVDKRQKVVEQVQYVADVKAGKMPTLPENMKAEMVVTANTDEAVRALQAIQGIKIDSKSFTVSTDDADAMARLREIRGIKIAPKSFTVSTDDADAMARLREIRGIKIAPKSFTVSTDDADAMARLREIRGIKIAPKSFTVSTDDADAMARLREIDGVAIDDKTFSVAVNDADTLAKVREIDGVTIDDKTMTVTATTDEAVRALQAIQGVMIQPKSFDISTDDVDALAKVSEIDGLTIDTKTFTISTDNEEALSKVREIQDLKIDPKTVKIVPQGEKSSFDNLVESVQAEIKFDQMKVDETTLHTLLQTALQNGLDGLALSYEGIQKKIAKGIDIPDSTWIEFQNEINEKLAEMGIKPIKINFETGEIANDGKEAAKDWRDVSTAISAVGSAMSSIEDPAAKIMGTIAQAIATIALTYAKSLEGTFTPWDWIAAAASGAATMVSVISTIHSATGYANGGIVKGNSYSGDNIGAMVDGSQMVGLNAGELVLTHAQQNALANELQGGGMQNMRLQTEVRGRSLIFVLDNELKAQGKGQLATFK